MALSRFKVGKHNKTAYERQKSRRCRNDIVPFGEKVWFCQVLTVVSDPFRANGESGSG